LIFARPRDITSLLMLCSLFAVYAWHKDFLRERHVRHWVASRNSRWIFVPLLQRTCSNVSLEEGKRRVSQQRCANRK